MSRNPLGVVSGVGAGAERSGGERSEPQRSGAPVPTEVVPAASHPNPEVVARPQRRSYTAEYKVRILREAEAAAAIRGGIGALLRREGLYSSLLVNWRRERAQGIREALTPQKRGPKSKRHPLADEMEKLQRQNARLNEELRKAHIIIDVQKKVAALLGHPVAFLLADLGVTKTHSRPHVSDDNPYSESQFRTMKYRPQFPDRFGCIQDSRAFAQGFFRWYNEEHYHSGLALLTPAMVHYQQTGPILQQRQQVLDVAYQLHPERFVRQAPKQPAVPTEVWINKPLNLEIKPQ